MGHPGAIFFLTRSPVGLALGSVCAVLVACALGSLVDEEPRELPSARSTNPLVAVANTAIATAAEAAGGYAEIMVVGLALVVVALPVVWVFPMLCSWCSCLRCANPPHAGCSHDVAHPRTAPESGACAEGSLLAGRRPLQESAAYQDAPPNDGMRRSQHSADVVCARQCANSAKDLDEMG